MQEDNSILSINLASNLSLLSSHLQQNNMPKEFISKIHHSTGHSPTNNTKIVELCTSTAYWDYIFVIYLNPDSAGHDLKLKIIPHSSTNSKTNHFFSTYSFTELNNLLSVPQTKFHKNNKYLEYKSSFKNLSRFIQDVKIILTSFELDNKWLIA